MVAIAPNATNGTQDSGFLLCAHKAQQPANKIERLGKMTTLDTVLLALAAGLFFAIAMAYDDSLFRTTRKSGCLGCQS
jgi:hypothetical protein